MIYPTGIILRLYQLFDVMNALVESRTTNTAHREKY